MAIIAIGNPRAQDRPGGVFRQVFLQMEQRLEGSGSAIRRSQHELEMQGRFQVTRLSHPQACHNHAQVKDPQLRFNPCLSHSPGRLFEKIRGIGEQSVSQVDGAGVEGGKFRLQTQRSEALIRGRFLPGMPLVVKQRIRSVCSLRGFTTCLNISISWHPSPVLGPLT